MVGFANPTLKRGANNHCAYGAEDGLLATGALLHRPLGGGHPSWSGFGDCVDANFIDIPPFRSFFSKRSGKDGARKSTEKAKML
jgi:hypothetical protein